MKLTARIEGPRGEATAGFRGLADVRLWSIYYDQIELADAQGKAVRVGNGGAGPGGAGSRELSMDYTFPPSPGSRPDPPTHLRIYRPEWVAWDLPLEFKDVPCPDRARTRGGDWLRSGAGCLSPSARRRAGARRPRKGTGTDRGRSEPVPRAASTILCRRLRSPAEPMPMPPIALALALILQAPADNPADLAGRVASAEPGRARRPRAGSRRSADPRCRPSGSPWRRPKGPPPPDGSPT